jgi:SprT protein
MLIKPLDKIQQQVVRIATYEYIDTARQIYNIEASDIPVNFDLKGRAAGMYRVSNNKREIRYNPHLFSKYYEDNISTTIPHEVAHYITDVLFGLIHIRPHGREWKAVMQDLGATPQVTSNYDLTGIPTRKLKSYSYQCGCTTHQLSATRHNKVSRHISRYHCKRCGTQLKKT